MSRLCLALVALAFAPSIASAQSVSPRITAIADASIAGTPCAGHVRVTWMPSLAALHLAGNAIGTRVNPDGSLRLVSCDVALEPVQWAEFSGQQRCLYLVHEYRHLALHVHEEGGVMDVDPGKRSWSACDVLSPLGDRVTGLVLSRLPVGWQVSCGAPRTHVIHCLGESGRQVRRYRVRVIGSALGIVRTR